MSKLIEQELWKKKLEVLNNPKRMTQQQICYKFTPYILCGETPRKPTGRTLELKPSPVANSMMVDALGRYPVNLM